MSGESPDVDVSNSHIISSITPRVPPREVNARRALIGESCCGDALHLASGRTNAHAPTAGA
eukprot:scaffold300758_cov36-Tisochrysis_lutea.AAC.1